MKRVFSISAVLLCLTIFGIRLSRENSSLQEVPSQEARADVEFSSGEATSSDHSIASPLETDYGSLAGSAVEDLAILRDTLTDCQLLFKDFDRYPFADNQAVMSFLRGNNPEKLTWISEDHPFVNSNGELVDRSGVPVVFHRLSGFRFEFRSSGPDQVSWTDDDLILR